MLVRLVPVLVRARLVKVAKGMPELKLEEALMEVLPIPHRLLLNSLHDLALDRVGRDIKIVRRELDFVQI